MAFGFSRLATATALIIAAILPAAALESAPATSPRVTANLVVSRDAARPGETIDAALVQRIAPGWHTYWRNPGDSGEATAIDWQLPHGASATPIEWPAPKALRVEPLVNYGYEGTLVLPMTLTVPADARPGSRVTLNAKATWLVCEKICIPEEGSFAIELPISAEGAIDRNAETLIAEARAALPQPVPAQARLEGGQGETLILRLPGLGEGASAHFFPYSDTLVDHAAPQPARTEGGDLVLTLTRSAAFKLGDAPLGGVVTFERDGRPRAVTVTAAADPALAAASPAARATAPSVAVLPAASEGGDLTVLGALLFAFLGGLILNLMPCVLPVLFIKAVGFAQTAGRSRAAVREQGLLFLAGVLATFALLAGLVIGLAQAGSSVGWGFQLQSPPVVIALAVIMVLIGLNLLGAFEIGGRAAGIGADLAGRGGRLGAFATGALAVVVATPCTAPFMGAAMGFAVAQPPVVGFAVFMALALGFALPVVLLSLSPGFARMLPRPGRWMVVLKQAFAFPMFATAIWLVWVASVQAGPSGVLGALVAVLAAGFVVWLLGVTGGRARLAGLAAALLVAVGAGWFVTVAAVPTPATARAEAGGPGIWSPERVAALQAEGKPVFVNFTAAWCITCLANERVALARDEVRAAFAERGIVYLKGDWTNRDPQIAQALAAHGRAGVPLYLVYPGRRDAQAEILPQLLTPDIVKDAVARATDPASRTAASSR